MIPEELRSTWSSPVGPFMVESNSAPGPLEDEKLGSWAMFVTRPCPAPSGLGALQALGKLGWSPQVSGSVIFLLGLCISIFCALTPCHPIVNGVWLAL